MSLLALAAASAAIAASPVAHSVELDHRGATYRVDYRPRVETRLRTIGMNAGPRPSTQRCLVTAEVSVERVIAGAEGKALAAVLPGKRSFSDQLPGDCRGRRDAAAQLVARKADDLGAHLAQAAQDDRQAALAAIESAHHFASN